MNEFDRQTLKAQADKKISSFKGILLGVSILLLTLGGCNQNNNTNAKDKQNTDWSKDGLKGKVKSVKETEYKVIDKFGEISKGDIYSIQFTEYNEIGNKTNEETTHADDDSDWKCTFIYDNNSRLIENASYRRENLFWKYLYEYDDNGNLTKEVRTNIIDGKAYILTIINKYDNQNQLIESSRYRTDGTFEAKFLYEYDKKGRVSEENYYNEYGNLKDKKTYKYDKLGNIVETIEFGDKTITEYNENETIITTYDSEGKLEHKTITKQENKSYIVEYYDDENKLIMKTKTINDDKGNCIEVIEYTGEIGIVKKITTREIEYYD